MKCAAHAIPVWLRDTRATIIRRVDKKDDLSDEDEAER